MHWLPSVVDAFNKQHILVWNEHGIWMSEFVVVQKKFLWRKQKYGIKFTYLSYQRGTPIFQATINMDVDYVDERLLVTFYSPKPNDILKVHESLDLLFHELKTYGKLESSLRRVLAEKGMTV